MRLLVIEDDRKVASFLAAALREDGYEVDVAYDGVQGLYDAQVYDYDALLVDIMLPGKNGYALVHELRAGGKAVPILILTARDESDEIVRGLDAGADDYVTKPFRLNELLARVRALVRRGGSARLARLLYADLEMDRLRHEARRGGVPLDLTAKEFELLEYLLLHPEEVIRRTELLEKVWDLTFDPMSNVVDVHVANLRRKLAVDGRPALIHTVRGVGYVLRAGAEV